MSHYKMTDEDLIDNAATCCQRKLLVDDESVRECIKLNVAKPLRDRIGTLDDDNDSLKLCVKADAKTIIKQAAEIKQLKEKLKVAAQKIVGEKP